MNAAAQECRRVTPTLAGAVLTEQVTVPRTYTRQTTLFYATAVCLCVTLYVYVRASLCYACVHGDVLTLRDSTGTVL